MLREKQSTRRGFGGTPNGSRGDIPASKLHICQTDRRSQKPRVTENQGPVRSSLRRRSDIVVAVTEVGMG